MSDATDPTHIDWRTLSPEDLEREYSPSSCVGGDISAFLMAYADNSETAREHCRAAAHTMTEVRYGELPAQTLDLVVPLAAAQPASLVVFIHGGYWQQLSKLESFFAASDCVAHGFAFAAVDYTLAPLASLDEIVAECRTAVRTLRDNATDLHIDADHIVVCGSSAGAHLSAMVGLGLGDGDDWRPAAVGLLSGVFELEPLIATSINDAVGLDVTSAKRNSPLLASLIGFPPALVAVGSNETQQFKQQSADMAHALAHAGTAAEFVEIGGRNHFDIVLDVCNTSTQLGQLMVALIERSAPN